MAVLSARDKKTETRQPLFMQAEFSTRLIKISSAFFGCASTRSVVRTSLFSGPSSEAFLFRILVRLLFFFFVLVLLSGLTFFFFFDFFFLSSFQRRADNPLAEDEDLMLLRVDEDARGCEDEGEDGQGEVAEDTAKRAAVGRQDSSGNPLHFSRCSRQLFVFGVAQIGGDLAQEELPVVPEFFFADAVNREEGLYRTWLKSCHIAQAGVTEYDIRRHLAFAGELGPETSQVFEKFAIDAFPRGRLAFTRLYAFFFRTSTWHELNFSSATENFPGGVVQS